MFHYVRMADAPQHWQNPFVIKTDSKIMAIIPTFETFLLETRQSLGLERIQSKKQARLIALEEPWQSHIEFMRAELRAIFDVLGMDPAARRDCEVNLLQIFSYQQGMARHIWTSGASPRQVIWHLAVFSYAPALGRLLANWNLAQPFDKGMPGGTFWFLPVLDLETQTVSQPVEHVVRWLLDLLGKPMDKAKLDLGDPQQDPDLERYDSMERNLYYWLKGKTTPHVATIEEYFPDEAQPDFRGCFVMPEDLSESALLDAARQFVTRKSLNADTLRDQIPMTQPGRIETILAGEASTEEVHEFARLLAIRYASPKMGIIRQRLRIARATQDAYRRLVNFLCPGVDHSCADPTQNKVLQLLGVIGNIYNLTVAAWKNGQTEDEEHRWFESQLPPWDRETILLSILPSRLKSAYQEVGEMLTRIFVTLKADDPLPDYVPMFPDSFEPITQRKLELITLLAHDAQRTEATLDRIRRSSAWRVLQDVGDFWIVSHVAQEEHLSPKARAAALQRLRELASTPDQVMTAILGELHNLLDAGPKARPKDVEQRVAALIAEAEANEAWSDWKAAVLQYRAKDCLARNDIRGATDYFETALDATAENSFGSLRGEIARDYLAVMVANGGLVPKKHEKPFRHMLADGSMIEGSANPSLEDTATAVAEYYWDTLYKPYPGYPSERPASTTDFKKIFSDTFGFIEYADWEGLRAWLKKNRRTLGKKTLSDVRGDSMLLAWMKFLYMDGLDSLPFPRGKILSHIANRRQAIALLVSEWPEQLNIVDFKRQSASMFAAQQRDSETLQMLLKAGADVNLQDYTGRTVLHGAVTGGSVECLAAVLERQPDRQLVTAEEGNTPLHTAVKMGLPGIVRPLIEYAPEWVQAKNTFDFTPLEFAEKIVMKDLPAFQTLMAKLGRKVGNQRDYEDCLTLLRSASTTVC